jgi:ferredoxin-NADP reductase
MKNFSSKLVANKKLTEDVFQFDFEWPEGGQVEFEAGQFFMMKVEDEHEKPVNRAYSVASPPSDKGFSLCVKLIPDGRGSNFLKKMELGDSAKFMAPFGHFVLSESTLNQEKDVIMISTGTGLAPFISMMPILFEKGHKRPVTLFFGVRHEADLFYVELLQKWEEDYDFFTAEICLSRPEDSWEGRCGRVTKLLEDAFVTPEDTEVYICGNGAMVKDVRASMIERGIDKKAIHLEQFTPA